MVRLSMKLCVFARLALGLAVASIAATSRAQTDDSAAPGPVAAMSHAGERTGAEADGDTVLGGVLTLRVARDLAMRGNPGLAASAAGVRAASARARQARAIPNPEIEIGIAEYDRIGHGFDSAELEVALSQRVELGGKRRWRFRQAEAESALADWDLTSERLDVWAETTRRFVAVVAAQRRLALAGASVEAAELTAGAVTERVKAGKEPPLQAAKASVEVALARLQHETEGNVLMAARTRLAAMWGQAAGFGDAEDTLDDELAEPENLERLRTRLTATPEWAREDQKIRLREAALASEMAARVPDLDVAAGVQRFEEDGTDAMTLGVALSLPLFDRNRYTIASARHELERARAEQHAAKLALQAGLADAHTELVTARGRARTLREQVVPTMEQAFAAAQEGYRQGKFDFLDVLDAQRGLFKAGTSLVNALADYYDARAEIERITAGSLDALIEGRHMEDRR